MRISDSDRTRAVEELQRHCSAGRITIDELAERVTEAAEADTLEKLDYALRDLPRVLIADPARRPPVMAPYQGAAAARPFIVPGAIATGLSLAAGAGVVALVVFSDWIWALLLIVGWVIGILQGVAHRRR